MSGTVYDNLCELQSANATETTLHYVAKGKLGKAKCALRVPCLSDYDPVCDSSGILYPNECELNGHGATIGANYELTTVKGKPVCTVKKCGKEYKPVCDTTAKLYNNLCLLQKANATLAPEFRLDQPKPGVVNCILPAAPTA